MKFYKRVDKDGTITSVESYSHDLPVKGAIKITENEYADFILNMPEPVTEEKAIDPKVELAELKKRISELEKKIV